LGWERSRATYSSLNVDEDRVIYATNSKDYDAVARIGVHNDGAEPLKGGESSADGTPLPGWALDAAKSRPNKRP
jgi:hypothetical protein